jgi:hypothetical protein
MTRKRKLKRRVRERQARTGESYVTARRHVATTEQALVDITAQAAALGFRCSIAITRTLAAQVEPVLALSRLRDELARPHANVATARMFSIAFGIRSPALAFAAADPEALQQFVTAVRAGATGASSDGTLLAIQAMGKADVVPVICMLDAGAPLVLMRPDEWAPQPRLFVSYHGRSYPVRKNQFVIGRGKLADLSLKDGAVSRAHAAVIWRSGRFFLKDLGSDNGIFYKGMQIDNKRIEDGDVFVLGAHELTFTIER